LLSTRPNNGDELNAQNQRNNIANNGRDKHKKPQGDGRFGFTRAGEAGVERVKDPCQQKTQVQDCAEGAGGEINLLGPSQRVLELDRENVGDQKMRSADNPKDANENKQSPKEMF